MSDIRIREMTETDLSWVMPIEEASFSVPWSEKSYRDFLQRDDTVFLAAIDKKEDIPVGFCALLLSLDEADVLNVAVDKARRGEGIAKRMFEELMRQADEKGILRIFLEVRESNEPAIRLYRGAGFEQVGNRKNYYDKPRENALLMRRGD